MANFRIIKPGSPRQGATRFVVGPSLRLGETLYQTLRPSITEYPERWPLTPSFPQPGNRASSRPKIQEAQTEEPTELNPDGTPKPPSKPKPPTTNYPAPRPREDDPANPDGYFTTPDTAALDLCRRTDGACFSYDFLCDAQGTCIAKVSPPISAPFVITHIQVASDAAAADEIFVQIYSAGDNDLSAPLNTTGQPVITDGTNGQARCKAIAPSVQMFPNYWERRAGRTIKITVYQLTLTGIKHVTVSLSLQLLT